MSRILFIRIGNPTGRFVRDNASGMTVEEYDRIGARVFGETPPEIRDGRHHTEQPKAPLVADFRDLTHATLFCAALALATNNPDHRAPEDQRHDMHVSPMAIAGRWYVVSDESDDRLAMAQFADKADADLFVRFMAR